MAASTERQRARRALANLRSFVRRTGLTGWTDRTAVHSYRDALAAVVAVEDAEGVDAAADLSDRLRELRWEAERKGLLTPGEILAVDAEVCGV